VRNYLLKLVFRLQTEEGRKKIAAAVHAYIPRTTCRPARWAWNTLEISFLGPDSRTPSAALREAARNNPGVLSQTMQPEHALQNLALAAILRGDSLPRLRKLSQTTGVTRLSSRLPRPTPLA